MFRKIGEKIKQKSSFRRAKKALHDSLQKILARATSEFRSIILEDSYEARVKFHRELTDKISKVCANIVAQKTNCQEKITVFPEGTRYFSNQDDNQVVIVEQHPQGRHVSFRSEQTYYLAMPYVQFYVIFQNGSLIPKLYVSATVAPISNLDQLVYHLPLPNVDNYMACLGDYQGLSGDISTQAMHVIGHFWQSQFTNSWNDTHNDFLAQNNLTLQTWQEKSRENPLFILNQKFDSSTSAVKLIDLASTDTEMANIEVKKILDREIFALSEEITKTLENLDFNNFNADSIQQNVLNNTIGEITEEIIEEFDQTLKNKRIVSFVSLLKIFTKW
jgi:hypothetical protein